MSRTQRPSRGRSSKVSKPSKWSIGKSATASGGASRTLTAMRVRPGGIVAQSAPGQHAGAGRAEQDFERWRVLSGARIAARRSRYADTFVDIVIGPKHAVATAKRAVAGRDRPGIAFQGPVSCATVASSCQHSFSPGMFRRQLSSTTILPDLMRCMQAATRLDAFAALPCLVQCPCLRCRLSP